MHQIISSARQNSSKPRQHKATKSMSSIMALSFCFLVIPGVHQELSFQWNISGFLYRVCLVVSPTFSFHLLHPCGIRKGLLCVKGPRLLRGSCFLRLPRIQPLFLLMFFPYLSVLSKIQNVLDKSKKMHTFTFAFCSHTIIY